MKIALQNKSASDTVRWSIVQANDRALYQHPFFEAIILHLFTLVQPDIPVLWVDRSYNRPST
ncbi:MAG: hypothetical protein HRU78_10560 [Gammaproteobacteria bacterium]|nr:MAG: hypothetical protein HRU78_10560 [Gammaproteobacteria bacterium]